MIATEIMQATAAVVTLRVVQASNTTPGATSHARSKCTQASAATQRLVGVFVGIADCATDEDIEVCTYGECYATAGATVQRGMLLTVDANGKVIDATSAGVRGPVRTIGMALAGASADAACTIFVCPGFLANTEITDTQTNLTNVAAAINTTGKYAGKPVWDSTNNRPVWAAGSSAASVWKDGANATVHTPV